MKLGDSQLLYDDTSVKFRGVPFAETESRADVCRGRGREKGRLVSNGHRAFLQSDGWFWRWTAVMVI